MGVVCGLNLCPRFFVCLFVCVVAFLCLGYSSGFVRFGQRFLVYSIEGAKIRCAEFYGNIDICTSFVLNKRSLKYLMYSIVRSSLF